MRSIDKIGVQPRTNTTTGMTDMYLDGEILGDTGGPGAERVHPKPEPRGGLRGFGFNRVHQLESSCCVMPSEDDIIRPERVTRARRADLISEHDEPSESMRTAAFVSDDRMGMNQVSQRPIAAEMTSSLDRGNGGGQKRRDKYQHVRQSGNLNSQMPIKSHRRVNSSNISEASSKFR